MGGAAHHLLSATELIETASTVSFSFILVADPVDADVRSILMRAL